jgi:hypothetical protein
MMTESGSAAFDAFWLVYPRHQAKKDARKAWDRLCPSPALVQEMLTALAWQIASPEWSKQRGQFVPLPASWLRGERWTDEAPETAPRSQYVPWTCPHGQLCDSQWRCHQRTEMDAMRKSG